jgi:outer membrane protein with beta-barrel domain
MSARLLVACALAVFAGAAATPAVAQHATTLRGPWLGAGLGTASAQVNCDLCASDRNGGLSGYVAGGLRVASNLHAGLELAGWFDNTDGVSQRLMLYGASLWWHPQAGARWFLKGGAGVMHYHAGTDNPDDEPLTASTAALQLGGGYDFRAGRKVWISPFANLIVTSSGNLTSGTTLVTDASFSMLQIGAGVTWR